MKRFYKVAQEQRDIVFIDETGFAPTMGRTHGWSFIGQKIYGDVPGNKRPRTSLIGGYRAKRLIAPMTFGGTCNAEIFNRPDSALLSYSEIGIVESCDEGEAKAEAFSAVPVSVCKDFEALDGTNDVFAGHAFSGKHSVRGFVFFRQRVMLAAFFGHLRGIVNLLQSQITRIGQRFCFGMQPCF